MSFFCKINETIYSVETMFVSTCPNFTRTKRNLFQHSIGNQRVHTSSVVCAPGRKIFIT